MDEFIIHQDQMTRTGGESLLAGGMSLVLGGTIGGVIGHNAKVLERQIDDVFEAYNEQGRGEAESQILHKLQFPEAER